MRMGGMSTAGWRSNIVINREDLRALRANGVWSCLPLIYLKYLFKIWGFVFRRKELEFELESGTAYSLFRVFNAYPPSAKRESAKRMP